MSGSGEKAHAKQGLREKQERLRGSQLELIVKAKDKTFAKKKLADAKAPHLSHYKYDKITTREMKRNFEPIMSVRNEVAHSRIIGEDDYERFMDSYRIISPIVNPSNYKELDSRTREEFTRSCEEAFKTLIAVASVGGAADHSHPLVHAEVGHGELGLFRG